MSHLEVVYDGVPAAGLVLVPPSADGYEAMVKEIKSRSLQTAARYAGQAGFDASEIGGWELPDEHDRSVIFINRGERPVVLLQVLWLFELLGGPENVGSHPQMRKSGGAVSGEVSEEEVSPNPGRPSG